MTIQEMSERRAKLVSDARKVLDKTKDEKRAMTGEEETQYEAIFKEVDELRTQIDDENKKAKDHAGRIKRLEDEERFLTQSSGRRITPQQPGTAAKADEKREIVWGEKWNSPRKITVSDTDEQRSAYNKWLAFGFDGMRGDEIRNLQADSPAAGGYTLAPQTFITELIKFVDNAVIIRQKARMLPPIPASTSLGAPSLDTDMDDADWTSELGTGQEDAAMAFGKRELRPHPLAKRIKVSNTLLRGSALNAEEIVRWRLGYKHSVALEKTYMTGTGGQQPLGLFTASSLGISTGQDVSTGNSTTAIAADNLFEVKYSLKPQYQRTAEWLFHRTAVKNIRKLKDGNGQYLWQPGLTGTPDSLLDRPVNQSEYAPSTFTTGQYVGLFGDFSFYWIVDSLSLQVQRLVELYAATNQTGFIGRLESDGMPVLEEAFARVKLA